MGGTSSINLSSLTIGAWVYSNDLVSLHSILTKGRLTYTQDFTLGTSGTDYLFGVGIGSSASTRTEVTTASATTGEWHFVVGTYDGTTSTGNQKIYVDGVLKNTGDSSIVVGTSYNVRVGLTSFAQYPFNGTIDEVIIYNRSLTETEIATLYDTGRSPRFVLKGKLGSELLVDGDMEDTGNPELIWVADYDANLTKQTTNPYRGSQVLRVDYNDTTNPFVYQIILTVGKTYRVTGWARSNGTAIPRVQEGLMGSSLFWEGTDSTSWQYFDFVGVTTHAWFILRTLSAIAGYTEWDDVSVKEITTTSNRFVLKSDPTMGLVNETGLVGHWTFDAKDGSTSSKVEDVSGNNNNGTVNGATLTNLGRFKEAYDYDGTSDSINAGNNSSLNVEVEFTLSAWIKTTDDDGMFISKGNANNDGYHLRVFGGTFRFYVGSSGFRNTNVIINDSLWHHIALTMDNNTSPKVNVYHNGNLVLSNDDQPNAGADYALLFGKHWDDSIYLNGTIDEIILYNRSLSALEVSDLYQGTKSRRFVLKSLVG